MPYNPLPLLITVAGLYLLVKLRLFFVLHPIRTLKLGLGALGTRDKIASFTLALAGTLGVGNVFGVAVGIIIGGAGSVFWLFVSAIFSSVIKYSEVTLAADNLSGRGGGMFYAIKHSFTRTGNTLSRVYAIACLCLALIMGASFQIHTVGATAAQIFNTPPAFILIIFIISVLFVILNGRKTISKITLFVIPLTTVIYIIMTCTVIFSRFDAIPTLTGQIIKGAFSTDSALGGAIGFLFSRALSEGYSRGILSNEAGAGTSTIAHTSVDVAVPAQRGVLGIFEVFFDTTLLCMLTAYAVLLSVPDPSVYSGGMSLILAALDGSLGRASPVLVLICVLAFAYSTVVCWYYYGQECIKQLTGRVGNFYYIIAFISSLVIGTFLEERWLVILSDVLLLILTALTLPTIIKNSDRIKHLSESSGLLRPR